MKRILAADIGGTNARFAHVQEGEAQLNEVAVFPCSEFTYLVDAIHNYLVKICVEVPDSICLAVAGPVETDWIDLPNNHWAFSQRDIAAQLGAPLRVINDFTAQILSIDLLKDSEFHWLGPDRPGGEGVRAVIGPGTGLGVSAMLRSGTILPSEGGHMNFAPEDSHEAALPSSTAPLTDSPSPSVQPPSSGIIWLTARSHYIIERNIVEILLCLMLLKH